MNAPYDGDRGRGANGDPTGPVPPTPPPPAEQDPYAQGPYAQDPYVQDAYRNDPHRAQDPTAQDPVTEALYDRAAHPRRRPGSPRIRSTSSLLRAATLPTRSCGPHPRRPSRRARPGISRTAMPRRRRSSWVWTT